MIDRAYEANVHGLIGRKSYFHDNNHLAIPCACVFLLDVLKNKPNTPDCPDKTEESHLIWMIGELLSFRVTGDKAHRWLGFIQGIMISRGYITVDEERKRTRQIFGSFEEISY